MAAALIASFRSFPIAFLGGMTIGIVQTEITRYVSQQGLGASFPFFLIILILVLRGASLPVRTNVVMRWPWVGSGRVRPRLVAFGVAVTAAAILLLSPAWIDSIQITIAVGLILLSLVVVTGYTGQLSLAQYAFAGFGAWVACQMITWAGLPFGIALILGVILTVPLAVIVGLPAVRTRGVSLAVVTLGVATALELMLFTNPDYAGGYGGFAVGSPTVFGWNISAIYHPERFAIFSLALLVVATLAVANLRRSPTGRRLLAVRTNEQAAASLGINVSFVKLYAFGLSGAIAALGGILLAFRDESILFSEFTTLTSITYTGFAHLGGIGYLFGPVMGAQLAPNAIGTQIGNVFFQDVSQYLQLIGGAAVVLLVVTHPDGMTRVSIKQYMGLGRKLQPLVAWIPTPSLRRRSDIDAALPAEAPPRRRATPKTLAVEGLTVRFGGVVALNDVSLSVGPGQIVGLIGPNGAGKTTLVEAVSGFNRPEAGSLTLDGVDIRRMRAPQRTRQGVTRSFQSLELFEDLTVLENIQAACDPRDRASYLRDLVRPKTPPLPSEVVAAIDEFGLRDDLDRFAEDLPYGRRRLLSIVRAVATRPSILMLDEPLAGISDSEARELAHLIRRLASEWGIGILLIEHNVDFVMTVCDHIVVLNFGERIAEGSPAEVRHDQNVIAAYLGVDEDDVPQVAATLT
jgi:sulfate-transporting ATPase